MTHSLKLLCLLAVQALHNAYPTFDHQDTDEPVYPSDEYTACIGVGGYLKLDQHITFDVADLLPDERPQCHIAVSPNCFRCPDSTPIICNKTTSDDNKYLKSVQPIPRLNLNLEYLQGMPSQLFDELNVNILEIRDDNISSSDLSILQNIRNLSTLIIRGQLQVFQNMTQLFSDLENLTTLIMDFSEISKAIDSQDPSQTNPKLQGKIPDPKIIQANPVDDADSRESREQGNADSTHGPTKSKISGNSRIIPNTTAYYREYHQLINADHVKNSSYTGREDGLWVPLASENKGASNNLPKLLVYGVVSEITRQRSHFWIKDSPIKFLYFRQCNIYVDSLSELLARLQNSLRFLDIHDSFLYIDDACVDSDDIQNALEYLLLATKGSTNQTILQGFAAANIGLKYIPYNALATVVNSLQYLSLYGNDLSMIRAWQNNFTNDDVQFEGFDTDVFPPMPKLLELDLRDCNLQSLKSDMFTNLPNLKVLLLAQNRFTSFHADSLRSLNDLQFLDMSKIDSFVIPAGLENINFTNVPNLQILDVSQNKLSDNFKFSGVLRNLKKLYMCSSFKTVGDIDSGMFETMTSLELLNLSGNVFQTGAIEDMCFSGLESLKELHLAQCSINSLEVFERNLSLTATHPFRHLKSLKLLDLSENSISFIHENNFVVLPKLEVLYMNHNNLGNWLSPVFSNLMYFKELNVEDNHLSSITNAMLQDFSKVEKLSICRNQFKCGCDVMDFVKMIDRKEVNNTKVLDGWFENLNTCTDENNSVNVPFQNYVNNDCSKKKESTNSTNTSNQTKYIVYFGVALASLLITLLMLTYYKWQDIRFFAHIIKNATILSFSSDETELGRKGKLYNYDVFISYSDLNRNWVLDELLPKLEITTNVKVCLHERDFQVGLSILENIISCIDQSRCIMLIISLSFIKSNWCQFELHLAQHRLLETRRERLILVLLEDIPRSKRSKMLNYLMKTKTYIVWPGSTEDPEARKLFWKRIHRAVVLQQKKQSQGVSFA